MTGQNTFKVHIVLIDINGEKTYPQFVTPLVHRLQLDSEETKVDVCYENSQLTIQRNDQSAILFRRPSYCPFTNLYLQNNSSTIPHSSSDSIAIGIVVVLESHDNRILITRRASHMRTFPSCWVCPGGGIEQKETLLQAGVRELQEEVGIEVIEHELETSQILALWESSFPPDLAHGLPRRHHAVIYYHIRLKRSSDELLIKIDPNEVDAYAWLSSNQIGHICKRTDSLENLQMFSAYIHPTGMNELPFALLATADHNQKENLTNGTRFALEQWYTKTLLKK